MNRLFRYFNDKLYIKNKDLQKIFNLPGNIRFVSLEKNSDIHTFVGISSNVKCYNRAVIWTFNLAENKKYMMDHNHHKIQNGKKPDCACGKECVCCSAEKLSVNCGCEMEAKQYEYQSKLSHPADAEAMAGKHDHEAAMTNPQIAKQMEADMRRRLWRKLILALLSAPAPMSPLKQVHCFNEIRLL